MVSYLKSLAISINYIEEHLGDEIDLGQVAKEAGYSLYHFQRIFQGAIGDSIKDYIRKRRITEAAKDLINTNRTIIEIGVKYGYQTRESFSRAFTQVYGRNPSQVRKERILYSIRQPMTYEYLLHEYNRRTQGMIPVLKERPAVTIVGKKFLLQNDNTSWQEIPLLWSQWHADKECQRITNRRYNNRIYGLCLSVDNNSFAYFIGHEVTGTAECPSDMVSLTIPKAFCAVFFTLGPVTESVQKAWKYIYTVWLPNSEYRRDGDYDIEYYYRKKSGIVTDLIIPVAKKH